jgi:hypothetical protein
MQKTPWAANSHSAGKEIPNLSWSPKVHYCVLKSPPLDLILSHMNPVHTFIPLSLILLSRQHSNCLFNSDFPIRMLYAFLIASHRATCPTHLILLNFLPPLTTLCEQYTFWNSFLLYSSLLLLPLPQVQIISSHAVLKHSPRLRKWRTKAKDTYPCPL